MTDPRADKCPGCGAEIPLGEPACPYCGRAVSMRADVIRIATVIAVVAFVALVVLVVALV